MEIVLNSICFGARPKNFSKKMWALQLTTEDILKSYIWPRQSLYVTLGNSTMS